MKETIDQEGVLGTSQARVPASDVLTTEPETAPRDKAHATARAFGSAALMDEGAGEQLEHQRRRGYRQDSSTEQLALLYGAQAGNPDAFAELYRGHVDRITRYVAARLRHEERDAVPDVVQETFTEALADLPNAHRDVTGWLLTHAAKAYIRHIRANRQQERAAKGVQEVVRREYAHGHDWQPRPSTVELIGHLMLVHSLSRLTPYQRQTIQHRYLEGQTQATTATLLGKTVEATKSTERRALARLRRNFTPEEVTS